MTSPHSSSTLTPPSKEELEVLVADLTEDERHVLLDHGTEAPFCGVFLDEKREGVYTCRLCGLPLFKAGDEVRERHRVAELHYVRSRRPPRIHSRHQLRHDPDGIVCARCGAITATSFPTARRRPVSATASTRSRSSSRPRATPAGQARPGCSRGRGIGNVTCRYCSRGFHTECATGRFS